MAWLALALLAGLALVWVVCLGAGKRGM